MENVILDVKDLCKTYIVDKRQNNVLRNICFQVKEGDMVAIMGPSGSGKSTLLYAVSGMDVPTSGTVVFDGKDITKLTANELANVRLDDMGFIFEKIQRAEELMRKLSIIEVAENDINEVSGGQLQRACICRSMMNDPKLLFADEPTGALNRMASAEVMEELVRLNQEGTTIMMVTHDVKVAAKCKRVLYIVDGTIKGEYLAPEEKGLQELDKERRLNTWLMDLGW